ncbi:LysR family transcriptional regulator [Cohnella nanjingensis]|uniref:LysR family transcriptional regulator n=1 Tax=Cohnella nanjingensis TaxID=1387779 RepID=A0A7X0VIC0_9BACL|nr:LysR family transcriptional regulator [Cohnella nanjingensis]MBB6674378.1 LysR family transcriptional regulator [Cohnella nanjingensis]
MNIQQLRVFVNAARCGTLTEVASELRLKQPTVSFHLKKLEETLGVELFRKHPRNMQLTDAGQTLLPYARRVCALLDEAGRLMTEHREQGRGPLKIGASYTPATYFMPPFLAEFQSNYPQVIPTLTVKQAGAILGLLRDYEVDVAVVSLLDTAVEGIHVVPLVQDDLKLVLPIGHPLSRLARLTVEDLLETPFLVHEQGSTSRELSEIWANENGLKWNIRMELGAIETIKESVKYGIGIGILPWRSVEKEVEQGVLLARDLPGKVRRRFVCLAYRREDVLSYHVRTFIQFMRERCADGRIASD